MVTLRRVGVKSAASVGFWLGVMFTLINLIIIFTILFLVVGVPPTEVPGEVWGKIAMGIFFSGVNSAISFGVFAFVYNFVSRAFGGLQLEFEPVDTATDKRKNGEPPIEKV